MYAIERWARTWRLPLIASLALVTLAACSAQLTVPATIGAEVPATVIRLPALAQPASPALTMDTVQVAAAVAPAVGMVIVNAPGSTAIGSAVVIASQPGRSYLVTNAHVVAGGQRIQVLMPDGEHYAARLVGSDSVEDLAVLSLDHTLPAAQFAASSQLQSGQPVVAIGSPLGQQASVTAGVISALNRTLSNVTGGAGGAETLPDVLQTDAAINPGNSGGPLINAAGQVIGINSAGASGADLIGYAIPSSIVYRVAQSLVDGRTPDHPYLGVCTVSLDQALASSAVPSSAVGSVVSRVASGSPAAAAGLRPGDVIESASGSSLAGGAALPALLQTLRAGQRVTLTVLRGGRALALEATLAQLPTASAGSCLA
ncbi:MAG TPA: trypsin-like peptidase domain-containing protein [Candidatus Nitrosotalea sp.]|nr:trypsin-like peptidase domain-containing protein [Candidatus Nitrosotalea sp.]